VNLLMSLFEGQTKKSGSWQNKLLRNKENPDRVVSPTALNQIEGNLDSPDYLFGR